jgi:RHS repeat-associated protein
VAQTGTLPNAYTYTGRELDASGLYYYRARYYLPSAGRFLTPDPIGLAGGLNAYAYVSSNPVNYTDPFGLFAGQAFGPAAPESPPALSVAALPSFSSVLSTRLHLASELGLYGYPEAIVGTPSDYYNRLSFYYGEDRPVFSLLSRFASGLTSPTNLAITALTVGGGAFGASVGVGARALPLGFRNADDFSEFGTNLYAGLRNAGFDDIDALFQGSSATGKSFHTGGPFDATSDFDIALAGESLFSRAQSLGIPLRSAGTRTGPLAPGQLEQLGLLDVAADLSAQAGRDVYFMIFRSADDAAARGPSIRVPRPGRR